MFEQAVPFALCATLSYPALRLPRACAPFAWDARCMLSRAQTWALLRAS